MYGQLNQYHTRVKQSAMSGYPNVGYGVPTPQSMSTYRARNPMDSTPWPHQRWKAPYGRTFRKKRPTRGPMPRRYLSYGQKPRTAAVPKQPGMVANPYSQGALLTRGQAARR